jgi:hypothetical protein
VPARGNVDLLLTVVIAPRPGSASSSLIGSWWPWSSGPDQFGGEITAQALRKPTDAETDWSPCPCT